MSTLQGGPGNIVTNGLVLYLDAANTLSYTSGSTVWNDLSGNNNNGTLINGPTFSSGNAGSIVFDGVSNYGLLGTLPQILNNGFSFEAIFKVTKTPLISDDGFFNPDDHTGGAQGFYFWISPTSTDVHYIVRTESGVQINRRGTLSLLLNKQYHISYTYEKNTSTGSKLYINGSLFETLTTVGFGDINNTLNYVIGTRKQNYSSGGTLINLFGGNIGALKFYNRALSSDEILQNYNATKGRFGL